MSVQKYPILFWWQIDELSGQIVLSQPSVWTEHYIEALEAQKKIEALSNQDRRKNSEDRNFKIVILMEFKQSLRGKFIFDKLS